MRRLRALTEAECYARCYGAADANVRTIRVERRPPRFPVLDSGERLRSRFEELLDSRDPDEASEAA